MLGGPICHQSVMRSSQAFGNDRSWYHRTTISTEPEQITSASRRTREGKKFISISKRWVGIKMERRSNNINGRNPRNHLLIQQFEALLPPFLALDSLAAAILMSCYLNPSPGRVGSALQSWRTYVGTRFQDSNWERVEHH
jgi:hypothetical protein